MENEIKTIFELLGENVKKESCVEFDEHLCNTRWIPTAMTSYDYDNVIRINRNLYCDIYITWSDSARHVSDTELYLVKRRK